MLWDHCFVLHFLDDVVCLLSSQTLRKIISLFFWGQSIQLYASTPILPLCRSSSSIPMSSLTMSQGQGVCRSLSETGGSRMGLSGPFHLCPGPYNAFLPPSLPRRDFNNPPIPYDGDQLEESHPKTIWEGDQLLLFIFVDKSHCWARLIQCTSSF